MNRYLWEGAVLTRAVNPYLSSPLEVQQSGALKGHPLAEIYANLNHPDKTAIYGPLFLQAMALVNLIHASFLSYRILVFIIVLLLLMASFKLLGKLKLNFSEAVTFFLNPLTLVFGYGEGHNELIMMAFIAWGLYFLFAHKRALALLLGFSSFLIKPTAGIFLVHFFRKRYIKKLAILIVPLSLSLPFLMHPQALVNSLIYFGEKLNFMGSFAEIFMVLPYARWWTLGAFLMLIFLAYIYSIDILRILFFGFFFFCLCSPTVHPWYLLPLLFFNQFFGSYSAWLWSFLIVFYLPHYHHYLSIGEWRQAEWMAWTVYPVLFVAILWDIRRQSMRSVYRRWPKISRDVKVSLIIPTLNEEENLRKNVSTFQRALEKYPGQRELIFCDGGSSDKTLELLKDQNCIETSRGRGKQIARGLEQATGDVIFIAHADMQIDESAIHRAVQAILEDPQAVMGSFSMEYVNDRKLKFIQKLNDFRARILGISFGDQFQFFRKDALNAMGGFPAISLFEDVEVSLQMKNLGKILWIDKGGKVSNRRWTKKGYLQNAVGIIYLFHFYLIVRFFQEDDMDRKKFYRSYYKK